MGRLEHEEIYLSLSRKELQGLCKQHGLPANRSNIDLAGSLESLFRVNFYRRCITFLIYGKEFPLLTA